jgi:hypothetical protein
LAGFIQEFCGFAKLGGKIEEGDILEPGNGTITTLGIFYLLKSRFEGAKMHAEFMANTPRLTRGEK